MLQASSKPKAVSLGAKPQPSRGFGPRPVVRMAGSPSAARSPIRLDPTVWDGSALRACAVPIVAHMRHPRPAEHRDWVGRDTQAAFHSAKIVASGTPLRPLPLAAHPLDAALAAASLRFGRPEPACSPVFRESRPAGPSNPLRASYWHRCPQRRRASGPSLLDGMRSADRPSPFHGSMTVVVGLGAGPCRTPRSHSLCLGLTPHSTCLVGTRERKCD